MRMADAALHVHSVGESQPIMPWTHIKRPSAMPRIQARSR